MTRVLCKLTAARARFHLKHEPEPNTGCWLWIAGGERYGRFFLGGESIDAHRAAWVLFRGEIGDGLHVLHRCDTPGCVNPDHLWLGTHQENMLDASRKGRLDGGARKRTTLSPEEVNRRSLRALWQARAILRKRGDG